jgi:hypothetical protein
MLLCTGLLYEYASKIAGTIISKPEIIIHSKGRKQTVKSLLSDKRLCGEARGELY